MEKIGKFSLTYIWDSLFHLIKATQNLTSIDYTLLVDEKLQTKQHSLGL